MWQSLSVPQGILVVPTLIAMLGFGSNAAAGQPPSIKYRITGLCCPEREEDLRETVKKMPGVTLVQIDFKNAEATFAFNPAQLFPKVRAEQIPESFDNLLKTASFATFGIKPLIGTPGNKMTLVEIPVVGLDCKGCCFAAYEAIYAIDGVERAIASFKEGRVTAWIDPTKTGRATLEAALKKAGVQLKAP